MDGDVVHLQIESSLLRLEVEFAAVRDKHGIEVETGVGEVALDQVRQSEILVVVRDDRATPRLERLEPLELGDAERALDVGDAVVEAKLAHLVLPGACHLAVLVDAVGAQGAELGVELGVIRGNRSAFAGRDGLDGMERKNRHVGIAAGTDLRV